MLVGVAEIPLPYLSVICPSAPWENTSAPEDRAWDLCYSLAQEYGYAEIRQNGMVIGDYSRA